MYEQHPGDDLKQILRQDLIDFILFFLLKKYLAAFPAEHILPIARAISEAWAKRIQGAAQIVNHNVALDLIAEIFDSPTGFNTVKKESDKILDSEVENLCKLIYNIACDSLHERKLIDMSMLNSRQASSENKIVSKKGKKKKTTK